MFSKFGNAPKSTSTSTPSSIELPKTAEFLQAVVQGGCRLSYAALTTIARHLGEDTSKQLAAQRGSALVKALPADLQPYVCRKKGGYHKSVQWTVEVPSNLKSLPVIDGSVIEAYEEWSSQEEEEASED